MWRIRWVFGVSAPRALCAPSSPALRPSPRIMEGRDTVSPWRSSVPAAAPTRPGAPRCLAVPRPRGGGTFLRLETQHLRRALDNWSMNRKIPHRLPDSECRVGTFFLTVNTARRRRILSQIRDNAPVLSPLGIAVVEALDQLRSLPGVGVEEFVIMPDHIHFILMLNGHVLLRHRVGGLKSRVTGRARAAGLWPEKLDFWQKSYFDTKIRDQRHLSNVRQYIRNNPADWQRRLGECGALRLPHVLANPKRA